MRFARKTLLLFKAKVGGLSLESAPRHRADMSASFARLSWRHPFQTLGENKAMRPIKQKLKLKLIFIIGNESSLSMFPFIFIIAPSTVRLMTLARNY